MKSLPNLICWIFFSLVCSKLEKYIFLSEHFEIQTNFCEWIDWFKIESVFTIQTGVVFSQLSISRATCSHESLRSDQQWIALTALHMWTSLLSCACLGMVFISPIDCQPFADRIHLNTHTQIGWTSFRIWSDAFFHFFFCIFLLSLQTKLFTVNWFASVAHWISNHRLIANNAQVNFGCFFGFSWRESWNLTDGRLSVSGQLVACCLVCVWGALFLRTRISLQVMFPVD